MRTSYWSKDYTQSWKRWTRQIGEMIHAVFFDGLSMREYAKQLDVYPRAVVYRVERLLKALRKML